MSRTAREILRVCLLSILAMLTGGCAPIEPPEEAVASGSETLTMPRPAAKAEEAVSGVQQRVVLALRHVRDRDLLTTNGFWTIFHGILGVGPDATLLDPSTRKKVNALDYLCRGGTLRGMQFLPTAHGLDVQTGPISVGQGHQDQFVAEMAQWGMPIDRAFVVGGKSYTFRDFVRHTQMRARVTARQELSWAILILAQYVGTDANWVNEAGEKIQFEDLVRYELQESIEDAACGGTHRLFGLTWAWHLHRSRGGKAEGVWRGVIEKTAKYKKLARKYQNPDGALSTRYMAGPGNDPDVLLRIGTTGHVFEWLALALDEDELRADWMQEAASALALMILDSAGRPLEGGALYHAAHGLHIYHKRVWGRCQVTSETLMVP